jgi:DNA-binding CsgD family transcriptional regulator/pimeloyl-ACP methyl ester carboxylesterase
MQQQINFARSADDWRLAWSVMGSGQPALYFLGVYHLTRTMEDPAFAAAVGRAAAGRAIVRFDPRGCGLSQRGIAGLSQSIMCSDIEAVLDAGGFERVDLIAANQNCLWVVPFAVSHPERVNRLVLGHPMARWRLPPGLKDALTDLRNSNWETYTDYVSMGRGFSADEARAFARLWRETQTRDDYACFVDAWYESPIEELLPLCKTPTLVVKDAERKIVAGDDTAQEVASLLPNVRVLTFDSSGPRTPAERLTSEPVLAFLDEGWAGEGSRGVPRLSAREREVLALVAAGKTDVQIAEALTIAPGTASRHVHNLLTKLGAANRTEAVALAGLKSLVE